MSADIRTVATWLRLLATTAEAGDQIDPRELRWCALALEDAMAPMPLRPRAPWWRRWLLPRRRIA